MHVLLINEGTYPFHWGGVSTWCHLLIRDLPDVEFTLFSLVADPRHESQFILPDNVVELRVVPLWGICEMLEFRPDLTLKMLHARRHQTSLDVVANEFVPIFRAFLYALYTNDAPPAQLGQLIHQMYRVFQVYDFDTMMRSEATWNCFREVAQECFPQAAALHGYPDVMYTLWEVNQGLQWLYHWLFPLASPLPKTDIAHASTAGICTMIAVVAKLEYGAAYMLSEHGIYLRERYLAEAASSGSLFLKLLGLRFARRMAELSYAMADQISPCCDYNQRWELRNGASPDQLRTIYYGADSGQFVPDGKPIGKPPVVVWVGRINPLKDVITLLRAAALVKDSRPDIEFRLFGGAAPEDASYYAECMALHEELGLQETVKFAGYISNTASAYNQGDVVVLCSVSEGFPFAILEAMFCGKPVVATAVGGIPEQIEGCGIAVEPRNPQELAAAIVEIMNDPDRCAAMGQTAREIASQEFTVHQSAEAYRSSYQRLLGQNTPLAATAMRRESEETGEVLLLLTAESDRAEMMEVEVGRPTDTRAAPRAALALAPPDSTQRALLPGRKRRYIHAPHEPIAWVPPDAAALRELAGEVLRRDPHPIDYLEIAAVLESIGITDQLAAQQYGVPDTFVLAENVADHIRTVDRPAPVAPLAPVVLRESRWQALRDYMGGPIALIPNVLLLIIINMYAQLGQWNQFQVLALSVGMSAGMLFSNGFVQAVMRRASLAIGVGSPQTAGRFLRKSLVLSGLAITGVALLALLVASWIGLLTFQERMTFVLSFLAISAIWLLAGVLSLLRAFGWVGLALAAGLLLGYAVDRLVAPFSSMHLASSTAIGFATIMGVIGYRVRPIFTPPAKDKRIFLPPAAYLIHEALPYFGYGSLYMLFVLLPHLFGWFGVIDSGQNRIVAVAGLEAGLTLSLPPLVLVGGVAERTLRHFWHTALAAQQATPGQASRQFGGLLTSFYWRHLRIYLLALAAVSDGVYVLFQLALQGGLLPDWLVLTNRGTLVLVFQLGLITYFFLGLGWFSCMFSLTLGRPQIALRAVVVGIIVTAIVGAPLSLGVNFSYAAVSFLVGALAFAAASVRLTCRLLQSADYYYYTSY